MMDKNELKNLIEALLLSANKPLTESNILDVFHEEEKPALSDLRQAIYELQENSENRSFELIETASGFRFRAKVEYAKWIQRLWEEKSPKYSKALLETLAVIAYRQPITRGEIEEIRGVSLSTSIFRTLQDERNWIKVVGHKDVPGRPGIYATTKEFLDYFGLESLEALPPLAEIVSAFEEKEAPKQKELNLEDEDNSTEEGSMDNSANSYFDSNEEELSLDRELLDEIYSDIDNLNVEKDMDFSFPDRTTSIVEEESSDTNHIDSNETSAQEEEASTADEGSFETGQ